MMKKKTVKKVALEMIKKDYFYPLVLLILVLIPYFFIGLGRNSILGNPSLDMSYSFVPPMTFSFKMFAQGIIALWNPHIFSGTPFLIETQLPVLYPLHLINFILPISWAANFVIIVHQFMAGLFMYFFLRTLIKDRFSSFCGALVFALSSAILARIFAGHVTVLCAISWMPLLFLLINKLATEERNIWVILTGVILALQVFAGHVQFVFITGIGLAAYVFYFSFVQKTIRPFKAFFLASILGLGLSAVQIVPLAVITRDSLRGDALMKQMFSLPFEQMITLVCPGFFGWAKNGSWWGKWYPWEATFYVGILPLLLSFLAVLRRAKQASFFACLLLLSLVFSFGAYLPFYEKISQYLIGFNLFRSSSRFLTLGVFALAVLSALGIEGLKARYHDKKNNNAILHTIFIGIVLFLGLILLRVIIADFPPIWIKIFNFLASYDKIAILSNFNNSISAFIFGYDTILGSLNYSLLSLAVAILLFVAFLKNLLGDGIRKIIVVAFIVIDLWGFAAWNLTTFNVNECYLDRDIAHFLKANLGFNRFSASRIIPPNAGMMDGLSSVGGYSCFVQKRYNEFINFAQGFPADSPFLVATISNPSPLLGILNLKYVLVEKNTQAPSRNLKAVFSGDKIDVYENDFFLPKAFITHKAQFVNGRDNIFRVLQDKVADLKELVIIEQPVNPLMENAENKGTFPSFSDEKPGNVPRFTERELESEITQYLPNRVVVKARLISPGYLVLADTYNPDWQVYVDGKKEKLLVADYVLRAVFLTQGEHTIEFVYSPLVLKIGAAITLVFLILICILLLKKV